ncbi:hypothetical protein ADMFC3_23650 [Geovibrio sp. ADMFC3]
MEIITIGFVLAVFGAGLLSFFSPCVLPLLPVYIGYLSGGQSAGQASVKTSFIKAAAFTAGLSASFFILGVAAGALGHVINSHTFFIVCAVIVILFGIHQTGLIKIPFLYREKKLSVRFNPNNGLIGAFALGFLFSFGWTPCVGPVLGAVLGLSSQQGNALTGGGLLLVYSLGLSIPFFILAFGSHKLMTKVKGIYPHFGKIRIAGGILIMAMGVWMLSNQVNLMKAEHVQPQAVSYSANPAYELSLTSLQGDELTLVELQGKTVYIKFWTTWCPLCLAGLEDFSKLAQQYNASTDVAVISIVTPGLNGEVSKTDFIEWANAQELSFPVYFDESGRITKEFGVRAYPTAVYLDKTGNPIKTTIGDEMNEQINKNLTSYKRS